MTEASTKASDGQRQPLPVVLVGAGLANTLIALRLKLLHPEQPLVLLDKGDRLGGDHTWSFHVSDLAPGCDWILPFVTCAWDGYEVRFPSYTRRFHLPYAAIRSGDLAARLKPLLGRHLRLGVDVMRLGRDHVTLGTGERIDASLVVDGRGFATGAAASGWQTFCGLFVRTAVPHGLVEPTLMDAMVPQGAAYRFFYVLPWSEDRLLIEDTRYADAPERDEAASSRDIEAYAQRRGFRLADVVGREAASLPIPCGEELRPSLPDDGIVRCGVRAGLYHATTGYSFGRAVAFAEELACGLGRDDLAARLRRHAAREWRRGAFLRRLNAMLFRAAEPSQRWRVMQQFYRRDPALIARFYGMRLGAFDRIRLLSGVPPVPVGRGLSALLNPDGGRNHATAHP